MCSAILQFGIPSQVTQMSKVFAELKTLAIVFQSEKRDPDKVTIQGKSFLKQRHPLVGNR